MEMSALWLHPLWAFALPIAASLPIGWWMARALDPPAENIGRGPDALPLFLCRLIGRREPDRMDWRRYAVAMLAFNTALFALTFGLLYFQQHLPLNPDRKGAMSGDLIFNTVVSFVTNCSLQHYAGEQHLSYFSQLGVITFLDFVSTATGLACMAAVVRGLRGDEHLGDFYLDLARGLVLVILPCALAVALLLIATGVPMTFHGALPVRTLEGAARTIVRGPAAALIAIKQLGTIGGGFFGPNSTHPLRTRPPGATCWK